MSVVLVIDTGSSSMRGILFDERGAVCHSTQYACSMQTSANGEATYDPETFQTCLKRICSCSAQWAREQNRRIDALSFTSQRSSTMPIDRHGRPLDLFMTWYDKRSAALCARINAASGDLLYQTAGTLASPALSAPKIAWLRRNKPEQYNAAWKIIGIQDYLLFLCTGRLATDVTLASRTNVMDIHTLRWSDELLALYDIDREKLAELLPACSIVGKVTPDFAGETGLPAGIPVVSAGGDQQCSVLGQGLTHAGQAGVTCGSGAYVAAVSDAPVLDSLRRTQLNEAVSPGRWVLEASAPSSGTVQNWFLRTFYSGMDQREALQIMHQELRATAPGANGVIMLPDLAGKGCPDWNNDAHGLLCNIGFSSSRADFARAMLEGLASEIAECCATLCELVPGIRQMSATGGLTRFGLFNQIVADMIDFPVKRCNNNEATAAGAYLAAVWALGRFDSLD